MKKLTIIIIAAFTLMGCMSKEERRVKDFLNSKLKDTTSKVTDVEIVGEDSVLTLSEIPFIYNECLMYPDGKDSVFIKLNEYYYQADVARAYSRLQQEKDTSFIKPHPYDWRRLVKVKAKGDDGRTLEDIEVIYDNDRVTPIMLGSEYDTELKMWEVKISTLPQNFR